MLRRARTLRFTPAYVLVLAVAYAVLSLLPARVAAQVLDASSTDLSHLYRDPLVVLPASAVWVLGHPEYWVVAMVVAVGALELEVGARMALLITVGVHVVASLLSEGLEGVRILQGLLPPAAVHQLDVGPSYVLVGAAVAAVALARSWGARLLPALVVSPALVSTAIGLPSFDVAAVGHLLSVLFGVLAALAVRRLRRSGPVAAAPVAPVAPVAGSLPG